MIQLLYFARLRESLGSEGEAFAWPAPNSLSALKQQLAARGDAWQEQFAANPRLRAAVNQQLISGGDAGDVVIAPGDEVAFFPPVTGG